jgi:hypothetical protein
VEADRVAGKLEPLGLELRLVDVATTGGPEDLEPRRSVMVTMSNSPTERTWK